MSHLKDGVKFLKDIYVKDKDKPIEKNGQPQGGKFDKQDLEAKIKELEKTVKELALTIDTVEDEKLVVEEKLKKALADYQNLRSNNERRNAIRLSQLKVNLAKPLINIMDDIQYGLRARENMKLSSDVESWAGGLSASLQKMENVLKELDIEMMDVNKGDEFDSNKHEAISVVKDGKKGTVIEVVQPGYLMGEQVIRPAKVVVCK